MYQGAQDVLVVAGGTAWPWYQLSGAYVCQPGRFFRPTPWLAFYSARTIHGVAARIEEIIDGVLLSDAQAARLSMSTAAADRRLGDVIAAALKSAWREGQQAKVMLLSAVDDPQTLRFAPVRHDGPSAWTQGQRYTRLDRLVAAQTTDDLAADGPS